MNFAREARLHDLQAGFLRTNVDKVARQSPVAITVNGREDTVLLSHEDFQNQLRYIDALEAKLQVYSHLLFRGSRMDGFSHSLHRRIFHGGTFENPFQIL